MIQEPILTITEEQLLDQPMPELDATRSSEFDIEEFKQLCALIDQADRNLDAVLASIDGRIAMTAQDHICLARGRISAARCQLERKFLGIR